MYVFTDYQAKALRRIVADWIGEGFTTPPYPDEYYDILEKLGFDDPGLENGGDMQYDTRRPT